jgi:hypothetical protein
VQVRHGSEPAESGTWLDWKIGLMPSERSLPMKNHLLGVGAGMIVATALMTAQSASGQAPSTDLRIGAEVTLIGCLIQGSNATTFLLDRARLDPQSKTEKPKTYVVIAATDAVVLAPQVNHEVAIKGMAEQKTVPTPEPGKKPLEKDLPKLRASSLMAVSESCPSSTR